LLELDLTCQQGTLAFGPLCYPGSVILLNGPLEYNFQLLYDEKPKFSLHMKCSNTLFELQTWPPY